MSMVLFTYDKTKDNNNMEQQSMSKETAKDIAKQLDLMTGCIEKLLLDNNQDIKVPEISIYFYENGSSPKIKKGNQPYEIDNKDFNSCEEIAFHMIKHFNEEIQKYLCTKVKGLEFKVEQLGAGTIKVSLNNYFDKDLVLSFSSIFPSHSRNWSQNGLNK
ncbi:hypothetical protein C1645_809423 [Glomus cerebriforme]|uniref:Uncharacterized protein n=1 Tax=Glomus cerebriforme TaxID=658196 RepID=A0A397SG70_9GLOM|nr:hypothetical protein C1645_809423 [Glomus cerebriforme]